MTISSHEEKPRRAWLATLARASLQELEARRDVLGTLDDLQLLRPSETGMVMLRARAGGNGEPFNLGEATVTRCAVRLGDSPLGVGYCLGRQARKAELMACFDARLQQDTWRERLLRDVVAPLAQAQLAERQRRGREAASTRVEFYTMVRGET